MAGLSVGELFGRITADDSGLRRGLANAQLRMRSFRLDFNSQLRDLYDGFVARTLAMGGAFRDGFMSAARQAGDALRQFAAGAGERLRTVGRWFVTQGAAMGRGIRDGIGSGARGAITGLSNLAHSFSWHTRIMSNNLAHRSRDMWRRLISGSGQAGDDSGRGLAGRMLSRIGSAVRSGIGTAMNTGLSGLQRVTSNFSSNPYVGAIGAAMAAGIVGTALPLIGALLGAAVISVGGIGIIGLGFALLKNEPEVKKAAGKLADTVKGIFRDAAQPMIQPFKQALGSLEQTAKDVAPKIREAFKAVVDSGGIDLLAQGIDRLVKESLPGFVSMLQNSRPVFEGLRDLLGKIGAGLGEMFRIIGEDSPQMGQALSDLGTGIQYFLIAVGHIIGALARTYGYVRTFVSGVVSIFQFLFDVLVGHSIIPDMVNLIVAWLAGLPGKAASALAGLPGAIVRIAASAGTQMVSTVQRKVGEAVSAIRGLPGRARSALGSLGGILYASGQALVRGFINGIKAMAGEAKQAASSLVSGVRNLFPFSPAKEGPFSGKGWTLYSGQAIGDALAAGIGDRAAAVGGAVRSLMQVAERGLGAGLPSFQTGMTGALPGLAMGSSGPADVGGGGRMNLRITVEGPEEVKRLIRTIVIEDGGGIVQRAFGRDQ